MHFITNQIAESRRENIGGQEFIVAPVVAIRAGVLKDELVPAEEIEKHFAAWNNRPFVLGHPVSSDGENISANDPITLSERAIGSLFNTEFDGEKLRGEVWVDVAKAKALGGDAIEVMKRLEDGKPLEVSTAYLRDRDETQTGTMDGKEFSAVARNLRPDHLAALVGEIGACSWADGCGTPRVNQGDLSTNPFPNEHAARIKSPSQFDEFRRGQDELGSGISAIFGIKGTGDDRKSEIQAIRFDKDKFSPAEARAWLSEHDFEAIEFEPASESESEENVSGNAEQNGLQKAFNAFMELIKSVVSNQEVTMSKEEAIALVVEDGRLGLSAEDMAPLSEEAIAKLVAHLRAMDEAAVQQEPHPDEEPKEEPVVQAVEEPAANTGDCIPVELKALAEKATALGGIETATARLDAFIADIAKQRTELISILSANAACAFDNAALKKMETGQLETLQKSLQPQDYSSQASPVVSNVEQTITLPALF